MLLPLLAQLAGAQGGALTRDQVIAAGLDADDLATLRRQGALHVVRRGTYAVDDSLRATAAAHALHLPGDVVVSHEWAAAVHGWTLLEPPAEPPTLTRPRLVGAPPDTWPGLSIAGLPDDQRTILDGLPITTPPRTLVDCARTLPDEAAVVVADSALRAGVPRAAAQAVAGSCVRWPGIRQARAVLTFADARADSALESRSRWRLHTQGLPPPDLQVTICDEHGRDAGEVDFVWLAHRTVLETDGRVKYTSERVLWAEKLREDALRALGLVVVRSYWSDSAQELAAKVRRGFAAAEHLPAASYGYRFTGTRIAQRAQ